MWTKRLEAGRFRPGFSSDGRLQAASSEPTDLALIVHVYSGGIWAAIPA